MSMREERKKNIMSLCMQIPATREGNLKSSQLFKSGTSAGVNYKAVCLGRSKTELISDLGILVEKTDVSLFWLCLLNDWQIFDDDFQQSLLAEDDQIVSNSNLSTSKKNLKSEILNLKSKIQNQRLEVQNQKSKI